MIEERKGTTINQNIVQNIVLENREKLNVSGVFPEDSRNTSKSSTVESPF